MGEISKELREMAVRVTCCWSLYLFSRVTAAVFKNAFLKEERRSFAGRRRMLRLFVMRNTQVVERRFTIKVL
jgi:hypothetical protein